MLAPCRALIAVLGGILLAAAILWGASLHVSCPAPQAQMESGPQGEPASLLARGVDALRGAACIDARMSGQILQLIRHAPAATAVGLFVLLGFLFLLCRSRRGQASDKERPMSGKAPLIALKSVDMAEPVPGDGRAGIILRYANAGQKAARVTEIGSKLVYRRHPLEPGIVFETRSLRGVTLGRGEEWQGLIRIDSPVVQSLLRNPTAPDDSSRVFCVGYIAYADRRGRQRKTGYCRFFDLASGAWLRDKESPYEFSS